MPQFRQGDVGLEPVVAPDDLDWKPTNFVRLAEGEVTGHFHALKCATATKTDDGKFPLEVAEKDGVMYLRIAEPTPLEHQEHATITVPPGVYKRVIQSEYRPEAIRNVLD